MKTNEIETLKDSADHPVMLQPQADFKLRADLQLALTQAPLTPEDWLLTGYEQELLSAGCPDKRLHDKAQRHMLAHVFVRALAPCTVGSF